jgi:hypothetical protein
MHNCWSSSFPGWPGASWAPATPSGRSAGPAAGFRFQSRFVPALADAAAGEVIRRRAWRLALETLGRGLSVTEDDILTQGGIVALIGPTGVGKTTTIAKLAARYNLRHGSNRRGADHHRQLPDRRLRTAFHLRHDHGRAGAAGRTAQELQDAIKGFSDKSLVSDRHGRHEPARRAPVATVCLVERYHPHSQLSGAGRQRPAFRAAGNGDRFRPRSPERRHSDQGG